MNILQEKGWLTKLKFEKSNFIWDKLDDRGHKVSKWITQDINIGVLYDVDVDGLFSGYFIENYCQRMGRKVFRMMNKDKIHGLDGNYDNILKFINSNNIQLLFVPDAGTNDIESMKKLSQLGIKLVILDHHDIEVDIYEDDNVVVINFNEESFLPKLSGAGVTYRFIEQMNTHITPSLDISMYEQLVGITVLSDVCDMSDNENRYYVKKLYDNHYKFALFNHFISYGSDRSLMSYTIIPYLNAMVRLNRGDVAMEIINNINDKKIIKRIIGDNHNNVKRTQAELVDEMRDKGKILENDYCVIHLRHDTQGKVFNGLLANKLMAEYDKSALVVVYDKETNIISGSFRGQNFNFEVLKRYGIKCMGHDQACGISAPKDIFMKFCQTIELLSSEKIDFNQISYDIESLEKDLSNELLTKIAVYNEFQGKNVPPINIKIKHPHIFIIDVLEYPNYNDIIIGKRIIKDFNRVNNDDLIVTPTFDKINSSCTLIRV